MPSINTASSVTPTSMRNPPSVRPGLAATVANTAGDIARQTAHSFAEFSSATGSALWSLTASAADTVFAAASGLRNTVAAHQGTLRAVGENAVGIATVGSVTMCAGPLLLPAFKDLTGAKLDAGMALTGYRQTPASRQATIDTVTTDALLTVGAVVAAAMVRDNVFRDVGRRVIAAVNQGGRHLGHPRGDAP